MKVEISKVKNGYTAEYFTIRTGRVEYIFTTYRELSEWLEDLIGNEKNNH